MAETLNELILEISAVDGKPAANLRDQAGPLSAVALELDLPELETLGDPQAYAEQLSSAVFHAELANFRQFKGDNRLRLLVQDNAWQLSDLRWECLQGRREGERFPLAAHPGSLFSRLPSPGTPDGAHAPQTTWPLRILIAISNPTNLAEWNLASIDVARERSELERALRPLQGLVEIEFLEPPVSLDRIIAALEKGPHIFHYLGHGVYSQTKGMGALLLEKESTREVQLAPESDWLARLELLPSLPHLVFLAACESASRVNGAALVGMAPVFTRAGSGAVVAMRDKVGIEVAREFVTQFFFHLATHGVIDRAANQARGYLLDWGGWSWSIPTLFLARGAERIFAAPPEALEAEPAQPGEILVLIPEFKGHEEADFEVELREQLEERVKQLKLDNVRIAWLRKTCLGPGDEAQVGRLAARYGATLVIWGSYYRAAFRANFTITEQFAIPAGTAGHTPGAQLYRPAAFRKALISENDFSLLINFELPRQVDYLVFFTIGQLYYWEKDYGQAWQAFNQAIQAAGVDELEGLAQAYFYRGNLYAFHHQDRPAAIADYRRALELEPGSAIYAFNLAGSLRIWGNTLKEQGEAPQAQAAYQQARQAYSRALENDPAYGLALEGRALAHLELGADQPAVEDYRGALALRPRAETFNQLGVALRNLGRGAEALEALEAAILRAPGEGRYYFTRARVRIEQGDPAGARTDLQAYLRLSPQDDPARRERVRKWLKTTQEVNDG